MWKILDRNWVFQRRGDEFAKGVMGYIDLTPRQGETKRLFNGKTFAYDDSDKAKLTGKKLWFIKSKMRAGEMCFAKKIPDHVPQPPKSY
jgi:hypothetical protein